MHVQSKQTIIALCFEYMYYKLHLLTLCVPSNMYTLAFFTLNSVVLFISHLFTLLIQNNLI